MFNINSEIVAQSSNKFSKIFLTAPKAVHKITGKANFETFQHFLDLIHGISKEIKKEYMMDIYELSRTYEVNHINQMIEKEIKNGMSNFKIDFDSNLKNEECRI